MEPSGTHGGADSFYYRTRAAVRFQASVPDGACVEPVGTDSEPSMKIAAAPTAFTTEPLREYDLRKCLALI